MRSSLKVALLSLSSTVAVLAMGCSAEPAPDAAAGDEADVTAAATLTLGADFQSKTEGTPTAGKGLRIEYALERLPQCRGNVGGGGPGWNITGYYSENGSAPKTFEVSALSSDGKDRVAKPATITPSQGGDLAVWFQVSSRWGCSEFDSQFGQNYHLTVRGAEPEAGATISFGKDGDAKVDGVLKAGTKVRVRYEQDRLPACRRTERGNPVWTITGFAQLDREASRTFDTARPEGSDRTEVDALIDLPHAGELSLWFQVTSLGGCMQYDSKNGANYKFRVE